MSTRRRGTESSSRERWLEDRDEHGRSARRRDAEGRRSSSSLMAYLARFAWPRSTAARLRLWLRQRLRVGD